MIDKIIDTACEIWNVSREKVMSHERTRPLPYARAMIAKCLRVNTDMTATEIGEALNRNHTSILYYLELYDSMYQHDREFHIFAGEFAKKLKDIL